MIPRTYTFVPVATFAASRTTGRYSAEEEKSAASRIRQAAIPLDRSRVPTNRRRGCCPIGEIPRRGYYREALVLKYIGGVRYLQFRRGGAGVCYSSESARESGNHEREERELHKHARTERTSCSCKRSRRATYVTPYPAIVKLPSESVVTSDRAKRQIIIA